MKTKLKFNLIKMLKYSIIQMQIYLQTYIYYIQTFLVFFICIRKICFSLEYRLPYYNNDNVFVLFKAFITFFLYFLYS